MAKALVDLVSQTKWFKGELQHFFLDLRRWRKFRTRYKLDWQRERFAEASGPKIPDERGIYVFTAELSPGKLPPHGYILYMGITGDISNATLKSRYAQYIRQHKTMNGRPAITYMLANWEEDLFFNFVPLPNKSIDLSHLEKAFLSAVVPPMNKRDIEATITNAKAAAF
ncbi:hypothetical protein [Mesorhizobium sp.]|uniref:hypothetical protein n=1 Tax=Mesorhizobium sp. TaxID=1871066 RepID=UPI000FE962D6|nr:hypothetical protein [Mesorhizobium sp.]RWP51058.1 MAG: hypothetical protein EOR05_03825 [Mesorhizobium sp.]